MSSTIRDVHETLVTIATMCREALNTSGNGVDIPKLLIDIADMASEEANDIAVEYGWVERPQPDYHDLPANFEPRNKEPKEPEFPENLLSVDYWVTKDNKKLYPAKGQMTQSHIENVMAMIKKRNTLLIIKHQRLLGYITAPIGFMGDIAQMAFDQEFTGRLEELNWDDEEYFNRVVRKSKLWRALQSGLDKHKAKEAKVKELNKGILDM